MGEIFHCHLSVRGAMRWSKRELRGLFRIGERTTTPEESLEVLMDHLAQGHEILPMGECEGFDWKKGCPGHAKSEGGA